MADPDFYRTKKWKKLARTVRASLHHECQRCKSLGRYTRAVLVHHEYDRDDFPEYEMQEYVNNKRNLIPLCFECHEIIEQERGNRGNWNKSDKKPLTEEWW